MLSPLSTDWSWPRRHLSSEIMEDLFNDFDRVVNSFGSPTIANTVGFKPTCDISETDDHYLVSFDMPGVKKDDIKIEVQDNRLLISGERQRERKDENESTLRFERSYGKFERAFELPATINADKIEAQYENGVLNVALPKAESAKPRSIQIQSGKTGFFNKLLGSKKEDGKDVKDVKTS